jgi:hypothetical protein
MRSRFDTWASGEHVLGVVDQMLRVRSWHRQAMRWGPGDDDAGAPEDPNEVTGCEGPLVNE